MRAVGVYESMYGNTHLIAEAIAEGLGASNDLVVVSVEGATQGSLAAADLVVVGGPTQAHGMSHASTRKAAVKAAQKPNSDLGLDPDAGVQDCGTGSRRSGKCTHSPRRSTRGSTRRRRFPGARRRG